MRVRGRMTASKLSFVNVCVIFLTHKSLPDRSSLDTNQDISLIEAPSTEPPEHKGYLNKYTNVARGYSPRWFVLRRGILSCT